MSYLFLACAIGLEVAATSFLKASCGFTSVKYTMLSLVGYVISFYCLSLALRQVSIGIAYAIWSGVGTVGICLIGLFVYNQTLSLTAILGIVFIVLGVVAINFG
ncbi:multidrug efflux SMR transporter [Commensalibacter sp. Nvir]|uniref:DMT family transporter n=1 Tax=Commensalibacter sp. Nvir TaxID=3069817 RepID=UPI0030C829EB